MPRPFIESLECRRLLAAAAALPQALPEALADRIDTRLWHAATSPHGQAVNGIIDAGLARFDALNRIQVNIRTSGTTTSLQRSLQNLGVKITTILEQQGVAEAWIAPDLIDDVARLTGVRWVTLPDYRVTNVTSAGDSLLNADKVRQQFLAHGIDGTGIKIGVISDGADHRANVGSELPGITIDPTQPGSGDEGTAMLEIVHDLAPGAQLYFSGPTTSTDMVASINWLVGQGCDVVLDDLIFFGESYFSDSDIAQAAQNAVNSGVVYVTSAGNFGNAQHYQAQYLEGARFGNPNSMARYHRFSASPSDDFNDISIPSGGILYVFLEWSDAWGTSGNNYDLYLTSTSGSTVASSTTVQNGNDQPFEAIGVQNNGATFNGQIRIVKRGTAAARELEMFIYGNSTLQYSVQGDALVGQEAASGVLAVAAASASSPSTVEYFSSRGGSTLYTNFSTQTKVVRQSLDGTAIDGVQTAIGQSGIWPYNPFYGTSAASPHAGAIAALVLQANPSLTPAQVLQIMADTATDIGAPGYDTSAGAGLYNALDAVYKAYTPAAPDLSAASDSGTSDSDDRTNNPLPTFTGTVPAGSYVRLLVDGVESNAVQLGEGETTFALAPGAPLSDNPHAVTIRVASSSTVVLSNNSNPSAPLNIVIDTQAPTLSSASFNFDVPAQNITFALSESIEGSVDSADLSLVGQFSGPISSTNISAATSSANLAIFTFPGYSYGALPDDIYDATLLVGSVTDLAGNPLAIDLSLHFFYLAGDFNRDGGVNSTDLGILAMNWQQPNRTLLSGDATYDGLADVNDLYVLSVRWQLSLPL